jgi:hypothetical protein
MTWGAIFCFAIGAFALVAARSAYRTRRRELTWPSTRARVTSKDLERGSAGGTSRAAYYPAVRYAYIVGGTEHTGSTRDDAHQTGRGKWLAERALAKVPDELDVHYDPSDPATSTIAIPDSTDVLVWSVAGAVSLALGVVLLLA